MTDEYVIRRGHVLSMDPALGDLPEGDIHVRDGEIVAVAPHIASDDLPEIDAKGMIVLPGFVDTHWHLWESPLRGKLRGDEADANYFAVTGRYGPLYRPEDSFHAVAFGVAQGLLSGITTVHNWAHNILSPAHADAELDALAASGIRGRFSYGSGKNLPLHQAMALCDMERIVRDRQSGAMLDLGVALRTPVVNGFAIETFASELGAARAFGLPVSLHTGPKGVVTLLGGAGLIGPDLLLAHPQGLTVDELDRVARNGAGYSIAPVIELSYSAARNGVIQFAELDRQAVRLGLSIDSSAACGVDWFAVMRALLWSNWQRLDTSLRLKPNRIVEIATIGGARLLGLDDRIGSLTPGKRADIILLRAGDANLAPVEDPYYAMVFSGQPSNVDTTIVDGKLLVSKGRLRAGDIGLIVDRARASIDRMTTELHDAAAG